MTRIGVLSDSHGNLDLMWSAADLLRGQHKVELIFHLGDYERDGQRLRDPSCPVLTVPGTMCPSYQTDERILYETIEGLSVVCAHTPEDLSRHARGAHLAMHGHTHAPYMEQRGNTVWLNPGHVKASLDRGHLASYAVVDIEPGLISATIYKVEGDVTARGVFKLDTVSA